MNHSFGGGEHAPSWNIEKNEKDHDKRYDTKSTMVLHCAMLITLGWKQKRNG